MPGRPAVPALSRLALPARWSMCGGVSEVLTLVFHFFTCMCLHTIIILSMIFSSLFAAFHRGIPQGSVCQPCASECASCQKTTSHCLSCEKHYLLLDYSCRERCPESYYATERECLRCPDNCRECNKDGLCKSKYAGWSSRGQRNVLSVC